MSTFNTLGYFFGALWVTFGWSSCISEYEHPDVENVSGILVVEGPITNDTTFIRLSRSVELSESISSAPVINHAQVTIETDRGEVFSPIMAPEGGQYTFLTGELQAQSRYRVNIELDDHTYVSEYLEPLFTPEIESINLYKRAPGEPVHLRVNTQNQEEASRFYMWSYEEVWEYAAPLQANASQYPLTNADCETYGWREITQYDPYSPYYYCWSFGKSRTFLLGSSVKLSSNRIENLSLAQFDAASLRFTLLYYVKVRQNSIRQSAYNYFYNLKENAEGAGSIFGLVPSEMKGNLSCLTDETIPVIGYVEVSTTRSKEQFFSSFGDLSEYTPPRCIGVASEEEAKEYGLNWGGLTLYYLMGNIASYAYPSCVDCRESGGYHDRKPDFWPNDHF
ncbi:MAG: DUF4249 domain-containing protein [Rikenellaceae bacterium]|nr:DUF4249 domain-containing protein [Rikenellaceae bacterium]